MIWDETKILPLQVQRQNGQWFYNGKLIPDALAGELDKFAPPDEDEVELLIEVQCEGWSTPATWNDMADGEGTFTPHGVTIRGFPDYHSVSDAATAAAHEFFQDEIEKV